MDCPVSRRGFLAAAGTGLVGTAGCLGGPDGEVGADGSNDASDRSSDAGGTAASDGASSSSLDDVPPTADESLPLPSDPATVREQALSGGVPKDGIPSIDDPSFVGAADADGWLDPGDPVFGVAGESDVKAYPQIVLVRHEICNDEVDGRPVSVTYCPLTGTAMGYHRGGTTFGVSGKLVNNNLIMYDRETEAWWPQVLGTSVPGPWYEDPPVRSLRGFRVTWTTWGRWRDRYPETTVLSRETGHARNYGGDPYGQYNPLGGYYSPSADPMFPSLSRDDRFPPKAVVIGARTPEDAVAFHKDTLREAKLMTGELGGSPSLAAYDPGLDTGYLYVNPDEGSFEYSDGSVVGPDGGSYDPDALPLDPLIAFDAMWFAWNGFYPDSNVYATQ